MVKVGVEVDELEPALDAVLGEPAVGAPVPVEAIADAADRSGRQIARNEQSELILHNPKGLIGAKDSHGDDPRKSKG